MIVRAPEPPLAQRPPPAPPRLTLRQNIVLTAIEVHMREQGVPPTLRELAQRLSLARGVVFRHVQALRRKGFLVPKRTEDGRAIARTWTVVRPPL